LKICKERMITDVIFGLPVNLDKNSLQVKRYFSIGEKIKNFLSDDIEINFIYEDESFTSYEAQATISRLDHVKKISEHEIAAMKLLERYFKK
jgi:RNase H-fold protein (predicted Holliday junction resolvase)